MIFLAMARGGSHYFMLNVAGGSHFFKLFTSNLRPPPLVIYDQSLRRLQTLTWSYNIETLRKNINQRIDLLRRVYYIHITTVSHHLV